MSSIEKKKEFVSVIVIQFI